MSAETSYTMEQLIDNVNVSKSWKDKFKKLHIMYYNNYSDGKIRNSFVWKPSNEYKKMPFAEKMKISPWGNILAYLFGPLYYLVKGMWWQSIMIVSTVLIIVFLISYFFHIDTNAVSSIVGFYCGWNANKDYFAHKILNNKQIKSYILANPSNQKILPSPELIQNLAVKNKSKGKIRILLLFISLAVLLSIPIFLYFWMKDFDRRMMEIQKTIDYSAKLEENGEKTGGCTTGLCENNKKAVDSSTDYKECYNKAETKQGLKDYHGALLDYDKAVELNPSDSWLYRSRSILKEYSLKDHQGALADINKAIELNSLNIPTKMKSELRRNYYLSSSVERSFKIDLYRTRGDIYNSLKDYSSALKDFDSALSLDGSLGYIYFSRGISKYYLNDKSSALRDFQVAYAYYSATSSKKDYAKNTQDWINYIKNEMK